MKNRVFLGIVFLYFLSVGCISRHSVDDQYSFDGLFKFPFTEWYARMVDITGEKYKAIYLSKDIKEIDGPVDSINSLVIWINKNQDYPELFVSNDTIIAGVESFRVSGDTTFCRQINSWLSNEYLINDIDIINETIQKYSYSRILPKYPYIIVEFETWHNSFRVIPNWEYLNLDSTIIHREMEPLTATTKTYREQNIRPMPLVWIRLKECLKKTSATGW